MDKLLPVAESLTKVEVNELMYLLKRKGINGISKEQGYSGYQKVKFGFTPSAGQHLVLVQEKDFEEALVIVKQFERNLKTQIIKHNLMCPKCKNSINVVEKKKNLLERVLYMGVNLMFCKKCSEKWFV